MANQWETRERNTKRIALIISVVLHLMVFAAITAGAGNNTFRHLIERVFGTGQSNQPIADAKT